MSSTPKVQISTPRRLVAKVATNQRSEEVECKSCNQPSETTAAKLRAKLYLSRKRSVTNPEGIGGKSNKIDECQSGTQQTTAEAPR
jgi:hypothetical protein